MKNRQIKLKTKNYTIFTESGGLFIMDEDEMNEICLAETPTQILDFFELIDKNKNRIKEYALNWANNNNYTFSL